MTEQIITDSNWRKHITNEPQLHPPQRTWVGLTPRERAVIWSETPQDKWMAAVEAKLKQKNGYDS